MSRLAGRGEVREEVHGVMSLRRDGQEGAGDGSRAIGPLVLAVDEHFPGGRRRADVVDGDERLVPCRARDRPRRQMSLERAARIERFDDQRRLFRHARPQQRKPRLAIALTVGALEAGQARHQLVVRGPTPDLIEYPHERLRPFFRVCEDEERGPLRGVTRRLRTFGKVVAGLAIGVGLDDASLLAGGRGDVERDPVVPEAREKELFAFGVRRRVPLDPGLRPAREIAAVVGVRIGVPERVDRDEPGPGDVYTKPRVASAFVRV